MSFYLFLEERLTVAVVKYYAPKRGYAYRGHGLHRLHCWPYPLAMWNPIPSIFSAEFQAELTNEHNYANKNLRPNNRIVQRN